MLLQSKYFSIVLGQKLVITLGEAACRAFPGGFPPLVDIAAVAALPLDYLALFSSYRC